MAVLDNFKRDIQIYFGSKQKVSLHRTGSFKDLANPKSIVLFFCINTIQELEQVRKLFRDIKNDFSKVDVLVFVPGYEVIDVITEEWILLFNLDNFSIFGRMKEELTQRFENEQHELLISFAFDQEPFVKRIISQINAKFKIGPDDGKMQELFDMTVKRDDETNDFANFFSQAWHYLSVLNLRSS